MLILIRHAATAHNLSRTLFGGDGSGLAAKGRQQAEVVAKWLRDRKVELLYTSDYRRCLETAQVIGAELAIDYVESQLLRERNFGEFEGLSRPELIKARGALGLSNHDPNQDWYGVEGVESDHSVWLRLKTLFDEIDVLSYSEEIDTVIVSHAGVIKSFLHKEFEIPPTRVNCFYVANASASVLRHRPSGWEMISFWRNPLV